MTGDGGVLRRSWRWIAFYVAAFAVVAVLFVPKLPGLLVSNGIEAITGVVAAIASFGSEADRITITVQSPSVQTRERLINDRFEQAAWTDMLLKETMQVTPPKGPSAGPASSTTSASETQPNTPDADKQGKNGESAVPALQALSRTREQLTEHGTERMDWFRQMRGFRDLVRGERSDAMLDDRHDMDGNTLYNLIFNTTIIPRPRTRGFAAVRVLLTDEPDDLHRDDAAYYVDPTKVWPGEDYARSRFNILKDHDLLEIYYDWQERAQKIIDDSVLSEAALLRGGISDTDYLDLALPLEVALCERIVGLVAAKPKIDTPADDATCQTVLAGPQKTTKDSESQAEQAVKILYTLNRSVMTFLSTNSKESYLQSKPEITKRIAADARTLVNYGEGKLPEWFKLSLNGVISNPTTAFPAYEDALLRCNDAPTQTPSSAQRIILPTFIEIYAHLGLLNSKPPSGAPPILYLPCPQGISLLEKLRILEGLINLSPNALSSIVEKLTVDPLSDVQVDAVRSDPNPEYIRRVGFNIQSAGDKRSTSLPIVELGNPLCIAAQIWQIRLRTGPSYIIPGRGEPSYNEFFNIALKRDAGGRCSLRLSPRSYSLDKATISEKVYAFFNGLWSLSPSKGGERPHASAIPEELLTKLHEHLEGLSKNRDFQATTEAFAYGLSPRLGRSFTINEQVRGAVKASAGGHAVGADTESQATAEIAEADVAGFNPPKRSLGRESEFGWVLAPRTGSLELPMEERPLGALVAVPSWWRTVLLRICALGVSERSLPRVDDPRLWFKERQECRVEALRLPGTATELSRRLGIEVLSTPYVRPTISNTLGNTFEIHAGDSADLLLRGGRLWRSTVVTVGGQPSDQIIVLPDMNGIIARFKCIDRPSLPKGDNADGGSDSEKYAVPVRVWTSEGSAEGGFANILVAGKYTPCNTNQAIVKAAEDRAATSPAKP